MAITIIIIMMMMMVVVVVVVVVIIIITIIIIIIIVIIIIMTIMINNEGHVCVRSHTDLPGHTDGSEAAVDEAEECGQHGHHQSARGVRRPQVLVWLGDLHSQTAIL